MSAPETVNWAGRAGTFKALALMLIDAWENDQADMDRRVEKAKQLIAEAEAETWREVGL